jgi:hypothetical protein
VGESGYRNHHYVPQWYQRRFVQPGGQQELHYLSLSPLTVVGSDGKRRARPQRRRRPLRQCFAEEDLYTFRVGDRTSTELESVFFGEVDRRGADAVAWWADFDLRSLSEDSLHGLMEFMTTQKLRTPKGLEWLRAQLGNATQIRLLRALAELRTLYSTIWVESIWQIASATNTDTKFIVSDHPVTVYNRECGPRHESCRGANDPDVRLHGSHTLFPLGRERILILTNRSWIENPYQSARGMRPNPDFYRDSAFNFLDVQTGRELSEREVLEINFIIKSRAFRFVAAGCEEWLYPERHVSKSDWSRFGDGYLCMPDPRTIHAGGGMVLSFDDGRSEAYDSFGHRPWESGYSGDGVPATSETLREFKQEFAELFGDHPRGQPFDYRSHEPAG